MDVMMPQGNAKGTDNLMYNNQFWAIFNLHTFMGDTISRKMTYYFGDSLNQKLGPWFAAHAPLVYLSLSCCGAVLALLRIPILMWPGLFLIFLANGAVYASSTKRIDDVVPRQFNLIATSVWFFIGDIGSVLGSNTWEFATPLMCEGKFGEHGWENFCICKAF